MIKDFKIAAVKAAISFLHHRGPFGRLARALHFELDFFYMLQRFSQENNFIQSSLRAYPITKPIKVSVLLPSYGIDLLYVRRLIRSVLRQTYDNWEVCICDDCDPTPKVFDYLKHLEKTYPDKFRVIRHERNGGISAATKSALALATGDVVAFLDADDLLHKRAFELVVGRFCSSDDIDFVYTDHDFATDLGHRVSPVIKPGWSPELLLNTNYINHLTVVRRTCLTRCGDIFSESVAGSQDWDLCIRILENARRVAHIPIALYHWRRRPGSVALGPAAKPWAYAAAGNVRLSHVKLQHPQITTQTRDGWGEILLDKSSFSDLPKVGLIFSRNAAKIKDLYEGSIATVDALSRLTPKITIRDTLELVLNSRIDCAFVLSSLDSAPQLDGTLDGLLSYALLPNVGAVWGFQADNLRLALTPATDARLSLVTSSRSSFSKTTGNILTGPGHGVLMAADKFLRAALYLKENLTQTSLDLPFDPNFFWAHIGLANLLSGLRNVGAASVRLVKPFKLDSLPCDPRFLIMADPYL